MNKLPLYHQPIFWIQLIAVAVLCLAWALSMHYDRTKNEKGAARASLIGLISFTVYAASVLVGEWYA